MSEQRKTVNLGQLKTFALTNLPMGSTLRDVILTETEELDAREFLGKVGVWMKLFELEVSKWRPNIRV